ncbi:MAG: hypothetical protein WCO63_06475 [Bacteroidota bacterium]
MAILYLAVKYCHRTLFLGFIVFSCLSIFSCVVEETSPPVIRLLNQPGLVFHDTILPGGTFFNIGIEANSGSDPLTNITIKSTATSTILDSGIHINHLNLIKLISKSIADTERITITVMDMSRHMASVSFLLIRDKSAAWGAIYDYTSLKLGAQASNVYQPCLSLQPEHIYPPDSASNLQDIIDVLYYYNPGGGVPIYASVFSSPGETEAPQFYPFLNSWTVKNTTYYNMTTTVTASDFNNCHNDSLLISAYDGGIAKRKFKFAVNGNVIPFQIASGKRGLILVKDIQGTTAGFAEIAIKIQL